MLVAVVRIRGRRNVKPRIRKTLELLRLHKPNHAVVYKESPSLMGMLNKVKDYVAYGNISEKTFLALLEKRGEKGSKKLKEVANVEEVAKAFIESGKREFDPVFRLHPPRKGWKDIKKPYTAGGDLGKRPDMDSLLKRMM